MTSVPSSRSSIGASEACRLSWETEGCCEASGVVLFIQTPFYAWRRELQRRDAEQPLFVPIRSLADEQPAGVRPALELVLASGRRIRVAPGFDATTLRQLLAVAEEEPC